jgi:FKBP-type peptidyl-prolyl cis-trans isomerase (trigger factor)
MIKISTVVTKKEKSTADIVVTVAAAEFETVREETIAKLGSTVKIDGFRVGHVPTNILVQKLGEDVILGEMADVVVNKTFVDALTSSKLDIIGRPSMDVTTLEKGKDFVYTLSVSMVPEITLPDYKKIAGGVAKEAVVVEEKDVDDVLLELRKMRAHQNLHGTEEHSDDEAHTKAHADIDSGNLPVLTDEDAASFGDFKTVADLTAKVKENVTLEKEQRAVEKRRNEILEAIIKETKADVPEVLVQSELERMLMQMKGDVAGMGGKFEDYLAYIKKTETELKNEWRADAEKRALVQLVLNEIAVKDKIEVSKDLVQKEADRITAMYKDADKENAYAYVYQMMLNEEVLKTLEK